MQIIEWKEDQLTEGVYCRSREKNEMTLLVPAGGGGAVLPVESVFSGRYLSFMLEIKEEHSAAFNLLVYEKGTDEPAFTLRFGILPGIYTPICIDWNWLDARELFPERNPGALKFVCHGRRVEKEAVEKIVLTALPSFHEVTLRISGLTVTDEYPELPPLPEMKLVDAFGQNRQKEWKGKIPDQETLQRRIARQFQLGETGYPFGDWSDYGGWKEKRLTEGSGFFRSVKAEGRWWLADPCGYAFFSMGPDCVNLGTDCRVDGIEPWMEWLPDRGDPVYKKMYREFPPRPGREARPRKGIAFSFMEANLYRAAGENYYEAWQRLIAGQLKHFGMNTLGNWSDRNLFGTAKVPYVTSLPEFPSTEQKIFRDFPDVLSEEYAENARRCAAGLESGRDDPYMIGYFLRNEPSWAFVDNLVLADEVLFNPEKTVCKEELIRNLREKYKTIAALNQAWNCQLTDFDELYLPQKKVSCWSAQAEEDMRGFSRRMLRAYVEIPCRECRKADPNHMILGMRWAWISDPDLVTGWENFDVFSINCYAVDPTSAISRLEELGVDLPVMIGEFHFGALDRGLTATGLEGVRTQRDRGLAYRYYCERVAAHPYGVGCHYFQCYDQFALGRFDGENYNIGLFDICLQPYPEMAEAIRDCSGGIYRVKAGEQPPSEEKAESIPMIAY